MASKIRTPITRKKLGLPQDTPTELFTGLRTVATDPSMSDELNLVWDKRDLFESPAAALFAGVGLNKAARRYVNLSLDVMWGTNRVPADAQGAFFASAYPEIVIGGGITAAIYASVRRKLGYPKPIVLEKGRIGGQFAVTNNPGFYLNSRNRPGTLSVPRNRGNVAGALNVMPEAIVQPADLTGDEYQTNDVVAWAVRAAIATQAIAFQSPGYEVLITRYLPADRRWRLQLKNGQFIYAKRVIVATGLGQPSKLAIENGEISDFGATTTFEDDRIMDFNQFMRRMDTSFPLDAMQRVAVIGSGDSGKTVIEALTGQGPSPGLSVPTVSFPAVDWYGVDASCRTKFGWEQNARSRYNGIGRLLPTSLEETGTTQVTPYGNATTIIPGYGSIIVNGRPYDHVIITVGFGGNNELGFADSYIDQASIALTTNGLRVGRQGDYNSIGLAGPAAALPNDLVDGQEPVSENNVSVWRYADRTARLAQLADKLMAA